MADAPRVATPCQRAAWIVWQLAEQSLPLSAICRGTGLARPRARCLLAALARCVPLAKTPTGEYRVVPGALLAPPQTPQQRAAALAFYFGQGARLTVQQVATLLALRRAGAARLLNELAYVLPILDDASTQPPVWSLLDFWED